MIVILTAIFVLVILNIILIIPKTKKTLTGKDETNSVISSDNRLTFSIIISAKNEAENIPTLINSILKIDYPLDNFEVIIIDDHSSDETFNLCSAYSAKYSFLKVFKNPETGYYSKRKALSFGIGKASFDHIILTDADCLPEKEWLNAFNRKFNAGYEIIIGIAPFLKEDFIINNISCYENLRSSILSFSLAELGLPYTSAARNLGFTKIAFEKIGGYSKTFQSISGDDDLLIREALKQNLKVGLVSEEGSFVYSKTKKNLKDYLLQRSRHAQSSFYYLLRHKLILAAWHLTNLFFLLSPVLAVINIYFLMLLPSKLLFDLLVVKTFQKRYGYDFNWYEIIFLQICYELFLIVHFLNAMFRKVKWK
ncbi:MAG TPA: glycosyltransferase [Ignavibacteriaceae bacterium]|jgi:cellulose synthase/poly-beta-1,6-N-acetylglucosamine synthase-like glycosyltransferase